MLYKEMERICEIIFWISVVGVAYTYGGYAIVLAILARIRPKPVRRAPHSARVSIILAAYNEASRIGDRIQELECALKVGGTDGEVVVVCDGSSDGTDQAASSAAGPRTRVVSLARNGGKAAALAAGVKASTGEILIFADVRQTWAPDAVARLGENFADPGVGAVSGDLVLTTPDGVLAGVGMYWRYEKRVRRLEGRSGSQVGVTGAICAVRRQLWKPIPPGLILDDVYWPIVVAMGRGRVVNDPRARAFDRLPDTVHDEFRRKVRTLVGNYQLFAHLPQSLLPICNPIWWRVWSHKVFRLLVPWALLAMLAAAAVAGTPFYRAAFVLQITFYVAGVLGMWRPARRRLPLVSAVSSFVVLNAAAWVAFWVWVGGRAGRSWHKAAYRVPPVHGMGGPAVQNCGTDVQA